MKGAITRTVARTGVPHRLLRGRICILAYHRVVPEAELAPGRITRGMGVTPEAFEAHLDILRETFEVVDDARLADLLSGREPIDRKTRYAAITFDDGWHDTYETAWPILREAGMPMAMFVCPAIVSGARRFWWTIIEDAAHASSAPEVAMRLGEIAAATDRPRCARVLTEMVPPRNPLHLIGQLKACPGDELAGLAEDFGREVAPDAPADVMGWREIEEMSATGQAIGPHSRTHAILTTLDDDSLEDETEGCADDLAGRTLRPSRFYCFPNGDYDPRSTAAVHRAGFDFAFGLGRGAVAPVRTRQKSVVPRVNVSMCNAGSADAFRTLLAKAALRTQVWA